MKILFVTDLCPINENERGLPLTLLNFILSFIKLGHSVTLFRPNVTPNVLIRGRKVLPPGIYSYLGIKCINKNYLTPFFHSSQFNFLKNEKFDIILSHMPSGILAAEKISKVLGIPYYAAVHSSDIKVLSDIKYCFLWGAIQNSYKGSKGVLARSFWLKEKIENILPETKNKTHVVPSGVNPAFLASDKVFELKNKFYGIPYKIFSAGKLIKRKNFSSLIKAVAKIETCELSIAGTGPEMPALKRLVEKLNIKNRVHFLGQKSEIEMEALMKEAPVFILPSLAETFGMVYLEAMAAGAVTVCTRGCGVDGIIKDGINGFLTNPDENSIIQIIKKIQNLKNLETIAQRGVETAREMSPDKMARNYLNIIQNNHF